MDLPLVLITHPLPADWIALLNNRVRLIVGPAEPPGFSPDLQEHLKEAEGILCLLTDRVDEAILRLAPRLKVVSNMAVGYDNIDVPACTRHSIPVGNTPGVLTDATADLTLALLLSQARVLPQSSLDARNGLWKTWSPTRWLGADLRGATLGIVGMGKIGKAVAERAIGFGLKIIYTGNRKQPDAEKAYGATFVQLGDLLASSDFVSLHCPLSPASRGLIDINALKKMKPNAILINAARGPIVVTDDLVRALQEGWIRGAALDVTDPEPLPADHILYSLPNCYIVPHIGSATYGARKRMAEIACENLLAGLGGKKLPHHVNPEVYS